jgi:hypothetical protein
MLVPIFGSIVIVPFKSINAIKVNHKCILSLCTSLVNIANCYNVFGDTLTQTVDRNGRAVDIPGCVRGQEQDDVGQGF